MSPCAPFELYALQYAVHGGRSAADNMIGADPHEMGDDLAYYVWLAKRSDRVFVIDTGFGPEAARARGRSLQRSPAAALALLGVDAARVEDVILTHLHYDHAGGMNDFAAAQFHLQDSEAAYATGRCMCHAFMRQPFDVEDIVSYVRHLYAGNVCFHDGVTQLDEGLSLHRIGGHSAGLQVVRVWTRRGWVVVASDASHLYANMTTGKPFPILYNVSDTVEGYRCLHELADSPDHVIPGHDPAVMALYPALSPELSGIAVRLDVAPRVLPK